MSSAAWATTGKLADEQDARGADVGYVLAFPLRRLGPGSRSRRGARQLEIPGRDVARFPGHALDQLARLSFKTSSHLEDRVELRDTFTPLQQADLGSMETRAIGQAFLRYVGPPSKAPQVSAEVDGDIA